ncbi:MAG: hypothetical protein ABSG56_04590 [Bryobacteraceae bacterium]|jgi:predicted nucleic acid-binding protein
MTLAEMRQSALNANCRRPPVFDLGCDSHRERAQGRPISSSDAWIAATALVLPTPLVTNNPKDYCHLDNLQLISAAAT